LNTTTKINNRFTAINGIAIIVVLSLFAFGAFFANKYKPVPQEIVKQAVAAVSAISYDGQDGKSALDLLKENNQVNEQETSFGTFVTEINGIKNENGSYWMFYINDQVSESSSDTYVTKNSDKIEWRYEKIE